MSDQEPREVSFVEMAALSPCDSILYVTPTMQWGMCSIAHTSDYITGYDSYHWTSSDTAQADLWVLRAVAKQHLKDLPGAVADLDEAGTDQFGPWLSRGVAGHWNLELLVIIQGYKGTTFGIIHQY